MTVREQVATVPRWRHKIQLPDGVVTPGSQDTTGQLPTIGLPENLSGMSVLDIGCSDGFYSFECERRGASRVLAVDDYSSVYIDNPSGFNVAKDILQSKVEFLRSDLFDLDPKVIGQFDLVLFLGVLYHLRHPLLAMERLAAVCKQQLIMETAIPQMVEGLRGKLADMAGGHPSPTWMEFYPSGEVNQDPTTWWAPTPACAEAMLSSCGFCGVKTAFVAGIRGVFHGFSPQTGDEADRLVAVHGADAVAAVCSDVLGAPAPAAQAAGTLRALSITDFGRVRQKLAEARAKRWHQKERWEKPADGS